MKITRFILLVNFFIILLVSIYFYVIFDYQKNEFKKIITNQIKSELIEIKYIFEKVLNNKDNILLLKPLLDRKIASNSFNKAFVIKEGKNYIKSGDLSVKVPSFNDTVNVLNAKFNDLLEKKAIKTNINIFSKNREKRLGLYLFVNKDYIERELFLLRTKYIIFYLLIILGLSYFTYYVYNKYLAEPLHLLKEYSLQKINTPYDFLIEEFNEIKNSLSETFLKLNKTIKTLYKYSITDPLTKLANRRKLQEYVKSLIKDKKEFALIYIDLDNFKEINDYYGHSIGDDVLIEIAKILKKHTFKNELSSRIGGDEFILVWQKYLTKKSLEYRMSTLLNEISKPFNLGNKEISITASIGASIFPYDGENFDELLRKSDIALREAKKKKNYILFFNSFLDEKIQKEIKIKNYLPKALENNEFKLYFQPKIDKNLKIISCEALIRWQKPDGKIIPPNEFIEIAEKNGFIVELGKWIMRESFTILNEWKKDEYLKDISLAFNISFEQIKNKYFLTDFKKTLIELTPPLSKIEIEFTESVFLENFEKIRDIIKFFHLNNIKINLDDFGTGYSSIAFLKKFDIDVIKIDKTFVEDILDEKGKKYIKAIVDMAKALNKTIVAEGVENKEQFNILKEMDVDIYQGYLFAKPLPKEEFEKFVKSNQKILL